MLIVFNPRYTVSQCFFQCIVYLNNWIYLALNKNFQFTGEVFPGGREYAVAFMRNHAGISTCTLYFTTSASTANIQVTSCISVFVHSISEENKWAYHEIFIIFTGNVLNNLIINNIIP